MLIKPIQHLNNQPLFKGIKTDLRQVAKHCAYCASEFTPQNTVTIDHLMPKHLGGKSHITNYAAACHKCNNVLKRDKTLWQFFLEDNTRITSFFKYLKELQGKKIDGIEYSKFMINKIKNIFTGIIKL